MRQHEETILVLHARSGDTEAFEDLVHRYQAIVAHLLLRLVDQADIADDLAQEVWLQAYLSLPRLHDVQCFRSWLYGIALHIGRTYRRQRDLRPFSLDATFEQEEGSTALDHLQDHTADPEALLLQQELHHLVLKAVEALPPRERTTTLLFYYEQFSLTDISTRLALSVGTVKSRLHRARKHLQTSLAPLVTDVPYIPDRRKHMVPVHLYDIRTHLTLSHRTVILQEVGARRFLCVQVPLQESDALLRQFKHQQAPHPSVVQLLLSLVQTLDVHVQDIHLQALKTHLYYAILTISDGSTIHHFEAHPADALLLASVLSCPILVPQTIMEQDAHTYQADEPLPFEQETHLLLQRIEVAFHQRGVPFHQELVAHRLREIFDHNHFAAQAIREHVLSNRGQSNHDEEYLAFHHLVDVLIADLQLRPLPSLPLSEGAQPER